MIPVIVFTAGMFIPIWQELMGSVSEYFTEVLETTKQQLIDGGFGADAVNKSLVSTKQMLDIFIRVIPAVMVISAVAQFAIGYLLFIYLLERNNLAEQHPAVIEELVGKLIAHRFLQPENAVPPYHIGKEGFVPWEDWRINRSYD